MNLDPSALPLYPPECWQGDQTLLTWPSAAVLNSRQGKYPVGSEEWVRATINAASTAAREGFALVSGIGLATWELGVWAAGESLGGIILLAGVPGSWPRIKRERHLQQILREFTLSHQPALVVPYIEKGKSPKAMWQQRDRWILDNARKLFPVSIRPGGFFDDALAESGFSLKSDTRFRIEYAPRRHRFSALPTPEFAEKRLRRTEWEGWAVHWTRTSAGQWPGELARSYYSDLAASENEPPRSALTTLARITTEKLIRGSGRHMPLGREMVGFTTLSPSESLSLMRWRKRFVQVSFEPYGIAVRTDALLRGGARAIRYVSPEEAAKLEASERIFHQTVANDRADWAKEAELRWDGDLDLNRFESDEVRLITLHEKEWNRLPASPWKRFSFML